MYLPWIKMLSSYETKKYVIVYSNLKTVACVGCSLRLLHRYPPSQRVNVNLSPNWWFQNLANLHHFFPPLKEFFTLSEKLLLLEVFKFNTTVCKTAVKVFCTPAKNLDVALGLWHFPWFMPKLKLPCSSAYTDTAQCVFYNVFVSANEVQRRMWCTRCTGFLSSSAKKRWRCSACPRSLTQP